MAQFESPTKNDWGQTIKNDLKELGIESNIEKISHISKN